MDALKAAVLATLGPSPTPALRETVAQALRALADEQQRLAAAQRRQQARPPAARVGPRTGRGGRPSSAWIRIERRARRDADVDEVRIKLSRALYYQAGSPERLDVQHVGGQLVLTPGQGYAVIVTIGGIWINASGARDLIALEDGRYAAEVRGGAIVVASQHNDRESHL